MKNKTYTTGDVAEICGVSPDTVSRWFDGGQLQGYRLGEKGDRRIPHESLRLFMQGRGIPLERLTQGEVSVLVVDEDPWYLDHVVSVLGKEERYAVQGVSSALDAGMVLVQRVPQVVLLDSGHCELSPQALLNRLKVVEELAATKVVILFRDGATPTKRGFDGVLVKPFEVVELIAVLESVVG